MRCYIFEYLKHETQEQFDARMADTIAGAKQRRAERAAELAARIEAKRPKVIRVDTLDDAI